MSTTAGALNDHLVRSHATTSVGPRSACEQCLDTTHNLVVHGRHKEAMDYIGPALRAVRLTVEDDQWFQLVNDVMLKHPVRAFLHEDPLTSRAFRQPRGYAGDAVTLDLIYRHAAVSDVVGRATPTGKVIYQSTSTSALGKATQLRKLRLAAAIDATVHRGGRTALSVACGHLREFELVSEPGRIAITGVDHDPKTLSTLADCYGHLGVTGVAGSMMDLIKGRLGLGRFDLVYAAGLFDYLPERIARLVLSHMARCTTPGGTLIIANVMPAYADVGYMESFMKWPLIKRSGADMERLAAVVKSERIEACTCDSDDYQTYAYMALTHR